VNHGAENHPDDADLASLVLAALERRDSLTGRLEREETDCLRLFHGTQEGAPGLTVDRYGDLILVQSFHKPLSPEGLETITAALTGIDKLGTCDVVYNDRSEQGSRVSNDEDTTSRSDQAAYRLRDVRESGLIFAVQARHRGQDPWLFLDQRAARAAFGGEANGRTVLNLFAYTCSAGVAAAANGATRVVNIDFAKSALEVGHMNAERNRVANRCEQLASDVFPALRQLAGLSQPRVVRGRRLPPFPILKAEQFDLVFLDPPRKAKSAFGVVDLVRDYQALMKPALLATADGGVLYCSNNVAAVDEKEWHELLRRCAEKHGRPAKSLDVIRPDEDFPSSDGKPPLKVARLEL
jgi:23S rRNA (cytosine1962-C5)-methyltransferase